MSEVSLFRIESTLAQLMEMRDDTDLTPEEREEVNRQIGEYVCREIAKVDNVRGYLRMCEANGHVAAEEAARCSDAAKRWYARADALRERCVQVMLDNGKKKIEGTTGTLSLKKNPPSVDVRDLPLLPASMKRVTLTMDGFTYELLCKLFGEYAPVLGCIAPALAQQWKEAAPAVSMAADKKAIGAALKGPCQDCCGSGKSRTAFDEPDAPCSYCNGTGKDTVPGARWNEDSYRLEVK